VNFYFSNHDNHMIWFLVLPMCDFPAWQRCTKITYPIIVSWKTLKKVPPISSVYDIVLFYPLLQSWSYNFSSQILNIIWEVENYLEYNNIIYLNVYIIIIRCEARFPISTTILLYIIISNFIWLIYRLGKAYIFYIIWFLVLVL